MLHGRKGFSRLEWACKNVLHHNMTWLFYNFNPSSAETLLEGREPISIHHPSVSSVLPKSLLLSRVLTPKLTVAEIPKLYEQEDSLAMLEWLQLVSLASPRIRQSDKIDSFLSRYEVPDFSENGRGVVAKNMVRVRWNGFIPPLFIRQLFLTVRKEGLKLNKSGEGGGEGSTVGQDEERWFALTASAFGGYGGCYTVMQFAGRESLTWECD